MISKTQPEEKCGYIALIGRPNVGKSTLLNHILGKKLSITSRKPQTTQHAILGIKTIAENQLLFVDTPGLHRQSAKFSNRLMNRAAQQTLQSVDVVVWVIEALQWQADEEWILKLLSTVTCPVVIAINKIDRLAAQNQLLPFIQALNEKRDWAAIVPLSATKARHLDVLEQVLSEHLPRRAHLYAKEQITDKDERFIAAEFIREKLMRVTGQELPYSVQVEIEKFQQEKAILHIHAVIQVEKPGQKAIVIGDKGSRLKQIGQQARLDMERYFANKIFLRLWVKVRS